MIFFDQSKVPTIKFGKCFAEFLIPIALLKNPSLKIKTKNQGQGLRAVEDPLAPGSLLATNRSKAGVLV